MRLISTIGKWFDDRLQLGTPICETMDHPIPRDTAGWFYVFGTAATRVLALDYENGQGSFSPATKGGKHPCA